MTVADMVLYLAEHDDHHLVLMRKLLHGGDPLQRAR